LRGGVAGAGEQNKQKRLETRQDSSGGERRSKIKGKKKEYRPRLRGKQRKTG